MIVMKRTEPLKLPSRPLERNMLPNHLHDIHRPSHPIKTLITSHTTPTAPESPGIAIPGLTLAFLQNPPKILPHLCYHIRMTTQLSKDEASLRSRL